MKPPLHRIGIPDVVFMVLLSYLLFLPAGAIAQDQTSGGGNQFQLEQEKEQLEIQGTEQASSALQRLRSGVNTNSLDEDYMIFEHDQMWNRNPNPNPDWNFPLFEQGEPAGDINNDGSNDYLVTGQTNEVEGTSWKTAVFFGDNSREPEDIVGRELVPVGDLNGDGHADAVAVDDPESVEIYKGTESGYSPTGAILDNLDPANFNILGFQDFNGDERADIFAYSETTGDVQLVLGQINFSDMLVDDSMSPLSSSPKKVVAKDIDQDDRVEIVEFYGRKRDGQIQVLEFVDSTFLQDVYSFGFNPPFEDARYTDLHLIDANGDDYDDIYISLGRSSPKYLLEYDVESEVPFSYVEASNVQIWDGELVPIGDVNNDKHHDFIMGDPDNNDAPYIAYGSADLSSNISLDVRLEGDTGSYWSWEMGYNPYSGFGDLNGDGIDDALLSHTETDGESIFYGRRIIPGHSPEEELSSDNSEFQLYPREYFYNPIYEVEELGDVNGDGVDDFAIVLRYQGKVEIYHGGSSISESPDQSFSSGYYIDSITKGDFTGDGINDIVAISDGIDGRKIEVFEGGSSFSKMESIDISEFQNTDVITVFGVNYIGDINGNGSSDFIVGSGAAADTNGKDVYLNEAYIFYGGSSISAAPDDIIEYTDIDSASIDVAESATALGDLDGDGLGDFAVGAPSKDRGEVTVYLSNSDEPVRLTTSEGNYFGTDIESGDFNGDGMKDLAVSVAFSETVVKIYYGKEDFDVVPDRSLSVADFFSEEVNAMLPSLETIPDFDVDSRDELIVGSSGFLKKHAVLYSDIDSDSPRTSLIKGANANSGLGGTNYLNKYGTMASGDFTNNGTLDVVISQYNDNSDGIATSRVYRYELSDQQVPPGQVQEVEITEQDNDKVLSWQESEAGDLDVYLINTVEDNGELSDRPLAIVEGTEYVLPDDLEGVQSFVVRARDNDNNIGAPSVPVAVTYPATVSYDLNSGWNLTAFALEENSGQSELQELTSGPVYVYEGGYQEVEQMEAGRGYWAKFTDAGNHEFEGMPVTEKSIELKEGWNMIGGIGGDLPISLIDDSDEIIIPETAYSLDEEAYDRTDTLKPAQGYWIRSSAEGTVTLIHPKLIEQESEEVDEEENLLAKTNDEITEPFNQVTISDDDHSAELYFGQKLPNGVDKRRYTLPPMPPGDVFDARFEGDRRLMESDKVDIRLNAIDQKPLKLIIEAGSGTGENRFVVKEFADGELQAKHTVNDSEEIVLKHNQTESITITPVGISEVEQQDQPDEFDLNQNYPNPFNPTTQIQYSVAEATDVKIDVFNILGRRIVTLINERQEPGTYEVTFDGSDLASGIYLYRLQAGDFISTKKFILAK